MEFEDSRLALFPEPNAYIQKFDKDCKEKNIKKVVFQEPYETLPNFYINNNFTKHGCDCIKNNNHSNNKYNNHDYNHRNKNQCGNLFPKEGFCYNHSGDNCNCEHGNFGCNDKFNHNDNCHNEKTNQNGLGFDLKSLLPLLSLFNKGGGADFSSLVGMLSNTDKSQTGNDKNPMNLISNLMSNKDMMSGMLNLFKGGGLNIFSKKQTAKKELKTTDFEIKNYTRVE